MITRSSSGILALCVIFISLSGTAMSAVNTSVLNPSTVDDGMGNSADANSSIMFGPLMSSDNSSNIECSDCIGDGGIRPFLDFAQDFAHAVIGGEYQYKWFQRAKDGDLEEYKEIINDHMGLIVCIAIGIVFVLVFPIVGLCVCCCRCCCGNCGGNRKTNGNVQKSCYRPCLMISLAILTVFVGSGGILVLTTNSSFSDGIDSFHTDMPTNLDSMLDYLKDSVKVLEDISTNDFNFTKKIIFRDLDNIGYLLGGDVKASLEKEIKLDDVTRSVTTIESALASLLIIVPKVNKQIQTVTTDVNEYVSAMTVVDGVYTTAAITSSPGLSTTIDPTKLPTLTGQSDLEEVKNASISNLLNEALKEVDDIPDKVQNSSETSVTDLKKSINNYNADVKDITGDLDIDKEIDRQSIKDDVKKYTDYAKKYDKYRSNAGIGLGCIILLIAVLFGLGVLFGCAGGKGSVPPHKRGSVSNCGGNLLLAACGIVFIFGSLIMLITMVLFSIGTPTEDYLCVALKDPSILDKLINDYELFGDTDGQGNYLGEKILDDPDKSLSLSEILSNCENNQAIYKALRMNESNLLNLTDILNYKSKFSVKERISSIAVDFSDIKLLTPDLQNNLEKLNNSTQYNISKYENELNQDVTKSATDFQSELQANWSTAPVHIKTLYTTTIDNIQMVLDKEGAQLDISATALKESIAELDETLHPVGKRSLSDEITLLKTELKNLDDNIKNYGNKSLTDGVDAFSNRLFRVTDSFIDYLLDALNHDLGKCYPVWDFYKTLFKDNLCGTLIGSMNGFWFALGWSLFFLMPSLIIAMKLSSHFRKMRLTESLDDFAGNQELKFIPNSPGPPTYMKPNKVQPMN